MASLDSLSRAVGRWQTRRAASSPPDDRVLAHQGVQPPLARHALQRGLAAVGEACAAIR